MMILSDLRYSKLSKKELKSGEAPRYLVMEPNSLRTDRRTSSLSTWLQRLENFWVITLLAPPLGKRKVIYKLKHRLRDREEAVGSRWLTSELYLRSRQRRKRRRKHQARSEFQLLMLRLPRKSMTESQLYKEFTSSYKTCNQGWLTQVMTRKMTLTLKKEWKTYWRTIKKRKYPCSWEAGRTAPADQEFSPRATKSPTSLTSEFQKSWSLKKFRKSKEQLSMYLTNSISYTIWITHPSPL